MHAIRQKCHDLVKFLLKEVPEIDLVDKNSKGMTALHLAIKSNVFSFVKLLFMKDHKNPDSVTKCSVNPKLDDIKGNICTKATKLLKAVNLKGMTPLIQAVDHGFYESFRFLIELCVHLQKNNGRDPVLTSVINVKDDRQETALLKAVRMSQMKVVFSIMHLTGPNELIGYQSYTQTDLMGRNVLHLAVIGKHKELIDRFVKMDIDHSLMRNKHDSKGKTPQQYDDLSQFT